MAIIDDLRSAGFDDNEINEYVSQERTSLESAGFDDNEITEYYGLPPGAGRPISVVTGRPEPTSEERFKGAEAVVNLMPHAFASFTRGVIPEALETAIMQPITKAITGRDYISPATVAQRVSAEKLPPAAREVTGVPSQMLGAVAPLTASFKTADAALKTIGLSAKALKDTPLLTQLSYNLIKGGIAGGIYGGMEEGTPEGIGRDAALFSVLQGVFGTASPMIKRISGSNWYRKLTIKERGLVVQTADDMAKAGHSEGTILKTLSDPVERARLRGEALRARITPEKPVEPLKPKAEVKPEVVKPTDKEVLLRKFEKEPLKEKLKPKPTAEELKVTPEETKALLEGKERVEIEGTRDERFKALADAQRGKPERAMVKVQFAMGGGVLNPVVENAGDLTHRMAQEPSFFKGGYEWVKEKVDKVHRDLHHPYGFLKEHNENLISNAKYYKVNVSDYREKINKALSNYADEHAKLTTYNNVQTMAKNLAIAVGRQQWDKARSLIDKLKEITDKGEKHWQKVALEDDLTIVKVESKPESLPEFKTTGEALKFGKAATPEQRKLLKDRMAVSRKQAKELTDKDKLNEAYAAATKAQFDREALESTKILKTVEPIPSEAKPVTTPAQIASERKVIAKEMKDITDQSETDLRISAAFKVAENLKASDKAEDIRAYKSSLTLARKYVRENPIYRLVSSIKKEGKLKYSTLEAVGMSKSEISDLVKRHPGLVSKTGKLQVDVVSDHAGFDSADAMVQAMKEIPQIEEATERLAKDEYAKYERTIDEARDITMMERIWDEEIKVLRKALGRKPAPRKDLKKAIRLKTGQLKIKNIIEIEDKEIIKNRLIAEAKAARKAFSEGRKAGVLKAKEHQRAIAEAHRAKKQIKEYITKLAKQISKPISKRTDFYYTEAIENLQSGIDTSFRQEKTLEQIQATKNFLRRKPERLKDMPVKLMAKLNRKNIQEYTIKELQELSEQIKLLRKLGIKKHKFKKAAERRAIISDTKQIVNNILNAEAISKIEREPLPVTGYTDVKGVFKKAWSGVRAITLTPSRIFDMLDGGKNFRGKTHQVFYDKTAEMVDRELIASDKRTDSGVANLKELGINKSELNKRYLINGTTLTTDQMIDVYIGFKNDLKKLAIIGGNNITEQMGNKIIETLAPKYKKLGDWMLEEYADNYPRLRETHIEFTNVDLGHEANYSPIKRLKTNFKYIDEEIADQIKHRKKIIAAYPDRRFTKSRYEKIPADYQQEIQLGAYAMWLEQVPKQEHYINFANHIKRLHQIRTQPIFRRSVETKFGDAYNTEIKNYVDRIANPNIYRSFDAVENVSRALRKHTVIAYLAYNIVTYGKQAPSVFLSMRDAGINHFLAACWEMQTNPVAMIKEVRMKDPQIKHRSLERELEEMKISNRAAYDRIISKIGKTGMYGIYAIDRVAVTINWKAVYNRVLSEGMSEMSARRQAQNSVMRNQPAAHSKDIAGIYAKAEYLNWFLQFSNQLNKIYNIATYDIPMDIKQRNYLNALLSTAGLGITATAIWIMTEKRFPDEPEDFLKAGRDQAINAIPLVGRQLSAAQKGWWSQQVPAFKPVEAVGILFAEEATTERKLKAGLEGGAIITGLPYTGPRRVFKAVTEKDVTQLIGGFGEIDLKVKARKTRTRPRKTRPKRGR